VHTLEPPPVRSLAIKAVAGERSRITQRKKPHAERCNCPYVTLEDGTELFVKDWGDGPALLFAASAASPSDIWHYQHAHFLAAGYRVIAYDRRGHGRSSQPRDGFDIDTLADDLAQVIDVLDLEDVTLIGHSLGCGEIVRYLARHGESRVRRVALTSTITPYLQRSADNPQGVPETYFEAMRAEWRRDYPGWLAANARPFFVPETSQALVDWGVALLRNIPLTVALALSHVVAETDFRQDLAGVSLPVLLVHGTADASAPIELTAQRTAPLLKRAQYRVYEDAPHGLMFTHMQRLNADLEDFLSSASAA
jgi:non-heme chloroperoxidase